MKLNLIVMAITVSALSACSSSSSNNAQNNFEEMLSNTKAAGREGENIQPADVNDLPDNANLNGQLALGSVDAPDTMFVGGADVSVNFTTGDMQGTATNFAEYEPTAACNDDGAGSLEECSGTSLRDIDGTLDIAGSVFDGNQFDFDVEGELSGANGDTYTIRSELEGDGAFGYLDEKLVALGAADGLVDVSGTETGELDVDAILFVTE